MPIRDGASCLGCGLANYEGFCPVCRGDYPAYEQELEPAFGPWGGLSASERSQMRDQFASLQEQRLAEQNTDTNPDG